jgi:hypothetical protein
MSDMVRQTHPYGFRSGEWGEILTTVDSYDRECYVVRFSDGALDWWPVDDGTAGYEFREGVVPPST